MENTVIVVPGLFGGSAGKYYEPLAEMLGSKDFLLFRAGADWEPEEIAEEIRRVRGHKRVVCLSLGAMVGNIIAEDTEIEVFYLCPYLGADFINRDKKGYAYKLRHVFKWLATLLMFLTKPFRQHRWYPLWGGTKPDGWFLSVYAISKQLKYAFSDTPTIHPVDGVVFSYGDTVVEPSAAAKTSFRAIAAWTTVENSPSHCNLYEEGKSFGRTAKNGNDLSADAKAYLYAFAEMLNEKH